MTVCLNFTLVIWTYLKSWVDAHCIRGTVPCIVKKTCPFYILYCTKRSHRLFGEAQCRKLCIKDKPASLKLQCVNKLQSSLGECKTNCD